MSRTQTDGVDFFDSPLAEDPDFAELVSLFVVELQERMRALEAHFRGGRRDELRKLVHQIKGSAGSYGFDQVTSPARELERLLDAEAEDRQIEPALYELIAVCGRCRSPRV